MLFGEKRTNSEKKDQEAALTRLGGVTRYNVNPECLKNQFVVGNVKVSNVVEERRAEIAKGKKKLELIFDSVRHFKKKMKANVEELSVVIEDTINNGGCQEEHWAQRIRHLREAFDEKEYVKSVSTNT